MPLPVPMPRFSLLRLRAPAVSLAALLAGALGARAQSPPPAPPQRPLLWVVADADSRVYLLGSVHALPAGTDVLPGPAADAYAAAAVLAFEVDLDLAPEAAAAMIGRAVATDGIPLSKRLGPADARRLERRLEAAGLSLALAESYDPWFVALMLGNVSDGSGYSSTAGVDQQLFARAGLDAKERLGLETVDDQVEALDGLPLKDQLAFLRDALDDGEDGIGLATLVAAWRAGDADALAALVTSGIGGTPGLRRRVLTDRNARWIPQIEALLDRTSADGTPEDVLVVVGAGHLVGPGSVVEMLEARGLTVTRVGE